MWAFNKAGKCYRTRCTSGKPAVCEGLYECWYCEDCKSVLNKASVEMNEMPKVKEAVS